MEKPCRPLVDVYIDTAAFKAFVCCGALDYSELIAAGFRVCMTAENVVELHHQNTPAWATQAVDEAISRGQISVEKRFGFSDGSRTIDADIIGGWGDGSWASQSEVAFLNTVKPKNGKREPLRADEAHRSLASRSFESVVLTTDLSKKGPLTIAKESGGTVIYVDSANPLSGEVSLSAFILKRYSTDTPRR